MDGEEEGEVVVKEEDRLLALALDGSWSHSLSRRQEKEEF